MRAAVIVFPGSNCDRDLAVAFEATGADVTMVWHKDTTLPEGWIFFWGLSALWGDCSKFSDLSLGHHPRRAGRICVGHLQWVSDFDRDRIVAGRIASKCGPEIYQ